VLSYESLQKTKLVMMEMITKHIISFALHRSKLKFKLAVANVASRREQLTSFFPGPRVLVKQSRAKAQGVHGVQS
jgi:hypothetical protein